MCVARERECRTLSMSTQQFFTDCDIYYYKMTCYYERYLLIGQWDSLLSDLLSEQKQYLSHLLSSVCIY